MLASSVFHLLRCHQLRITYIAVWQSSCRYYS